MYEKIFQLVPNPVVIVKTSNDNGSSNYTILDVNESFSNSIMRKDRAIGLDMCADFMCANDRSMFLSSIEIMKSQRKCSSNFHIKTLTLVGDSQFPVFRSMEWKYVKVDDNTAFLTATLSNESPQLSDRESELIDFFQKAPLSMHWLSGTGHVIWANDTELQELGYTASEYIGHSIAEFCPDEGEALNDVFTKLSRGETIRNASFKFIKKNGEPTYLSVDSNVSFHEDGTFKHTRCFLRNDTERRIKEAIRNAEMKNMKQNALAKDRFIRRIFHEIRTPMHVISGTMSSSLNSGLNPQDMFELNLQIQACLGLLEDLGFATMIEAGNLLNLNPKPFKVWEGIDVEVNRIKAISSMNSTPVTCSVNVYVKDDIPETINVDSIVSRVFHNLISNCISVCGASGSVSIDVALAAVNALEQNHSNQISVKLSSSLALTLDEKAINKAFQTYYSADMVSDESNLFNSLSVSPNLNLGWFVAYNAVQNLGGQLECNVSENKAVFSFRIPFTESKQSPKRQFKPIRVEIPAFRSPLSSLHVSGFDVVDTLLSPSKRKRSPSKRVLIVDDSPICQKVMVKHLADMYSTDVAANGQEAFDKLNFQPCLYDAVLMDLRMPVMDGITATRLCKELEHLKNVPIIILTAELGDEVRKAAEDAHASCFLTKPAKAQELLETLSRFV